MIVQNLEQYKSVGEWHNHFKSNGYTIPLSLCIGITGVMKRHNISFAQAFEFLETSEKIILAGRSFIYDFTGDEL